MSVSGVRTAYGHRDVDAVATATGAKPREWRAQAPAPRTGGAGMSGAACPCRIHWQRLYTVVDGARYEVEPAVALTPTSALFRAWCAGCGAECPHPFRLGSAQTRPA